LKPGRTLASSRIEDEASPRDDLDFPDLYAAVGEFLAARLGVVDDD
jgi:hypothetical protein